MKCELIENFQIKNRRIRLLFNLKEFFPIMQGRRVDVRKVAEVRCLVIKGEKNGKKI